jgi:peptidoglycan/LPS O-acetylase OafA/YrhL
MKHQPSDLTTVNISERIHPSTSKEKELKNKNIQHIISLDGLRGIAVILVFLEHVTGNIFPENSWINFGDAHMGRSGVYLFFILSSFLLTRQLLRPNIALNSFSFWLNYASRRILRIYPLYILVLLCYLVFPSFQFDFSDFIQHILLLEGRNHFWSIPVEVKYYLLLPLIAFLFHFILGKNLKVAVLILVGLILITSLTQEAIVSQFVLEPRLSIVPNLSIFLLGSLAAILHAKILELNFAQKRVFRQVMEASAWLSGFMLFLSFRTVLSQAVWMGIFGSAMPSFETGHWFYGVQAGFWTIFMISHIHGQGWMSRLLSLAPLRFAGMISFGIYLWHIAVMGYLKTHLDFLPELIQTLAIAVGTILISIATYRCIERPFMRIKLSFPATPG